MKNVFDLWREAGQVLPRNPDRQWGTRDPTGLRGLVFHQALSWGSIEAVARYHLGPNHISRDGLPSLSYTFAIRRNGAILMALDWEEKPFSQGDRNQTGDENAEFVSCCIEGMFHGDGVTDPSAGEPTLDQIESVLRLWNAVRDRFKWTNESIYGHFDFGKPSCPGATLSTLIRAIRFPDPALSPKTHDGVLGRQQALVGIGYPIAQLGTWGPDSRAALTAFQTAHGLVPDGVWGPRTQAAIDAALKGVSNA